MTMQALRRGVDCLDIVLLAAISVDRCLYFLGLDTHRAHARLYDLTADAVSFIRIASGPPCFADLSPSLLIQHCNSVDTSNTIWPRSWTRYWEYFRFRYWETVGCVKAADVVLWPMYLY